MQTPPKEAKVVHTTGTSRKNAPQSRAVGGSPRLPDITLFKAGLNASHRRSQKLGGGAPPPRKGHHERRGTRRRSKVPSFARLPATAPRIRDQGSSLPSFFHPSKLWRKDREFRSLDCAIGALIHHAARQAYSPGLRCIPISRCLGGRVSGAIDSAYPRLNRALICQPFLRSQEPREETRPRTLEGRKRPCFRLAGRFRRFSPLFIDDESPLGILAIMKRAAQLFLQSRLSALQQTQSILGACRFDQTRAQAFALLHCDAKF